MFNEDENLDKNKMYNEICDILMQIFSRRKYYSCICTDEQAIEILSGMSHSNNKNNADETEKFARLPFGYPVAPFCRQIAHCLNEFIWVGRIGCVDLPVMSLLDEDLYPEERRFRFVSIADFVRGSVTLWTHFQREERLFRIFSILKKLKWRGILDMLSVRQTMGTHRITPIPRSQLLNAFTTPYTGGVALTCGARALAKHCVRDSTESFWNVCTGTDKEKNKTALKKVESILDNAAWINIHELPGQLPIIEVRNINGYGARWSIDGTQFRGFLEPMKVAGWEDKYRH